MMLCLKAWRESRVRFIVGAASFAVLGALLLQRDLAAAAMYRDLPPPPFAAIVRNTVYGPMATVVYIYLTLLLGLGGLNRERAAGTAAFTLSLPVSRTRLLAARAGVGLVEVPLLALVPVVAIVASMLTGGAGRSYSGVQVLQSSLLFAAWGIVWFAVGMLWSTLIANDYAATLACLLSPFAWTSAYMAVSSRGGRFQLTAGDPFEFMGGERYIDPRTWLFVDLPWHAVLGLAVAAASVLGTSVLVARRRSY